MVMSVEQREKMYQKDYENTSDCDTYLLGSYRITVLGRKDVDKYGVNSAEKFIYLIARNGVPYKIGETLIGDKYNKTADQEDEEVAKNKAILVKALKTMMLFAYNDKKIIKDKNCVNVENKLMETLENDNFKSFDLESLATAKTLNHSNELLKDLAKQDRKIKNLSVCDVATKRQRNAIDEEGKTLSA